MKDRRYPRWALLLGYLILPWWGPVVAFGIVAVTLAVIAAAVGVPVGDVLIRVGVAAVVGLTIFYWRRYRSSTDWNELFRRLRAGEPSGGDDRGSAGRLLIPREEALGRRYCQGEFHLNAPDRIASTIDSTR